MIINGLSESDSDFWDDYEKVSLIPKAEPAESKEIESKVQINFLNKSKISSPIKPNSVSNISWAREYFEDKIKRVNEAKGPEIERKTIKAENKVKRFYADKISSVRSKYIRDFDVLFKEFNHLKQELVLKDEYFGEIVEVLADSDLIATETMTKTLKNKNPKNSNQDLLNLQALSEEVQNLNMQVSNLKDICDIYQKDSDMAKKIHEDSLKSHTAFKDLTESQINSLQKTIKSQELTLTNLKSSKQAELKELKEKFEFEISIMNEVQNRKNLHISQLQEELKNAKFILTNKYLRNKYFDSIKDNQDDISKFSKAQISQFDSIHKRTQSAQKELRRRDLSSAAESSATSRPHRSSRKIVVGSKPMFSGQMERSIFNTWSYD